VNIAAALARRVETKLLLVYVDQLHRSLVSDPIIIESAALQTRCQLDREAQRLRDLGTEVEAKVLSGSAFDQLVAESTNAKARLIVIGAVGHGLGRRLLVGSVAERTAETSPIPTLVLRPDGSVRGFKASTRSKFLWVMIFPLPATPLCVG
jgi:nucleotide-binding universal stress UspA family protein